VCRPQDATQLTPTHPRKATLNKKHRCWGRHYAVVSQFFANPSCSLTCVRPGKEHFFRITKKDRIYRLGIG
jgi:hypothetical protein